MGLAKTTRPRLTGVCSRARLFRALDRGRKRPVTWVYGPPGAGKTTLVASYLAARRLRTVWYQVDPIDADVATFFYYLGQAAPRRRTPLPLLTQEYRHALSVFARRYFRELCTRLKSPFALVFDNYQDAPSDCPLHDVLREALAEIPPGGRVIFISRSEPPPAFGRSRAHQALATLDWSALRFTRTEAMRLARKLAPRRWSRSMIRSLHESVDGWAAGLVLLLEHLKTERWAAPEPGRRLSPALFDYFAGEILSKTDPEMRNVLLQTAFLPSVTAPMAEALTGHPGVRDVLDELHRRNYFITRQVSSEPIYQYHALFREFLLAEARRTFPAAQLGEIRRAAAGLVEAAGQVEAAAALLRDAKEWERLGLLILRHAPALLAQGRGHTLEEWLAHLPETTLEEKPWLRYWRGMCRLGTRHEECRRDVEHALNTFRHREDVAGMFLAWSAMIFSYQVAGGSSASFDPWVAVFEALRREAPEFLSLEVEAQVAMAMLTVVTWRQPQHPEGAHWAERAIELTRRIPDPSLQAGAAARACFYYMEVGDFAKAALLVDEMRVFAHSRDVPPFAVLMASLMLGLYEFMCALPSYRRTVSDALELGRTTGVLDTSTRHGLLTVGLMSALSQGDRATTSTWLQDFAKDLHALGPGHACWYHVFVVWDALLRGDVSRAVAHQPEMLRLAVADGWPLDEALAHLVSAKVRHACGEERTARGHLERALEVARTIRSPYLDYMGYLTKAQLCLDRDQEAEGLRALGRAMALGKAGGYVNAFGWQPAVMAGLCARALEAGIEPEYVRDLIRKRGLVPDSPRAQVGAWPWPVKVFTLGRFVVLADDQVLKSSRKVQRKPLALLQALIALGGRHVREERLIDALWPDTDGDAAHFALTSAIHRLRRLLGHGEAIVRKEDALTLDARYCWVDVWEVERLLETAEAAASRPASDDRAWAETARVTAHAARLHRGPFLDGEPDLAWATPLADRLRRRLVRQLVRVGRHWDGAEQWDQAAESYEEALRVDPCAEDVYRRLMTTDHRLGRPAEVQATYGRCREALARRLGTAPSAETEALLRSLGTI